MEELLEEIDGYTEYLQTTEGNEIECISIEELENILKKYDISKR